MNKKGFVLIETLVVTMFVLLTFSILYSNAVPLLGKYKEMNYYNGVDSTYDLYHIENFLQKDPYYNNIFASNYKILTCNNEAIYNRDSCNKLFSSLEINEDNDELIFLKAEAKNELINDENVSSDVKNYLKTIEFTDNILILQNDGFISYINIDKLVTSPKYDFPYVNKDEDTSEKNLKDLLLENANRSTCNPITEDYSSKTNSTTIYFSGNNKCVNFNYVWYSGKLWRITSINPDGSIKMITDSSIVSGIAFGTSATYSKTSWVYQWLNEDFKDTLNNQENIIVQNASWNASWTKKDIDFSSHYDKEKDEPIIDNYPENPENYENQNIVKGNVGLLNVYECYKSYNIDDYNKDYYEFDGFLTEYDDRDRNDDGWYETWLLTKKENEVYSIHPNSLYSSELEIYGEDFEGSGGGIRPVVVLKPNILTNGGDGSKDNPYRLKDDTKKIEPNITKLNTRVSGEYVIFNDEVYRIIDIENQTTKLIKDSCVKGTDNTCIKKYLSSSVNYGAQTPSNDYWDYYLNNTWYNSLPNKYRAMLVQSTYYLGKYNGNSYKTTICATASNTVTTKKCSKTKSIWKGYVGLPRIGEMFSKMISYDPSNDSLTTWLITPFDNNNNLVFSLGFGSGYWVIPKSVYDYHTVQPTITLSQDVVITSGTGRSPEAAFRIALPN